jgi:hypothetical protein
MSRLTVRSLLVPLCLALAPAVGAQGTTSPWEPWIGCWDLVPRGNIHTGNAGRVCVLPTGNPTAVDLVSVTGDSITARQRLDATAAKRAVQQGDCAGVETVHSTGTRVYLRTTMKCGSQDRLVNGVMAISPDGDWLDVRGVAFGPNVGVRASRYREAPPSTRLPSEVVEALRGRPSGMSPARIAASGFLQLSDVVEASGYLEVGVLQTLLAERGQGFALDARQLLSLQDAGVAPSVIDVMVALSYPGVFALDRTQLGDPPPDVRGEVREVYGGAMYDPGYGYDPYGYGYGRGYGWYSGRRPVVVVQRTGDDEEHGKVVKGRGYVSGRDDSARSGAERSGDQSRGKASSGSDGSDSEKKGTSTGRKAKPKP